MASAIAIPAQGAVDLDVITLATTAKAEITALQAGTSIAGVNGVTMPAGGALTTGQVLRATGVATAAYGAVNLASSDAVTGLLPTANLAPGTAAQIAVTNAGATAKVDVTVSGDATLASTGALTVTKLNGSLFQSGVATLTAGDSGAITATITANTRIVVGGKTPNTTALTVTYAALGTDRSVGAPGSFNIKALLADGTINVADVSTVDWIAFG